MAADSFYTDLANPDPFLETVLESAKEKRCSKLNELAMLCDVSNRINVGILAAKQYFAGDIFYNQFKGITFVPFPDIHLPVSSMLTLTVLVPMLCWHSNSLELNTATLGFHLLCILPAHHLHSEAFKMIIW